MAKPLDAFTKDPAAELAYGFNWRTLGWLAVTDEIGDGSGGSTAPVWTITAANGEDPPDLTADDENVEDGEVTLVRLTGGTDGVDYIVRCEVTTTPGGDKDARSFRVLCRAR